LLKHNYLQKALKVQTDKSSNSNAESHEQVGLLSFVGCFQAPSRRPNLLVHQGELDFGIVELLSALPFAQISWDGGGLNDLDARKPDPMTRCHFVVHCLHSTV